MLHNDHGEREVVEIFLFYFLYTAFYCSWVFNIDSNLSSIYLNGCSIFSKIPKVVRLLCEWSLGLNFPPFFFNLCCRYFVENFTKNCELCSQMKTNCSASVNFWTFLLSSLTSFFVFKVGPKIAVCFLSSIVVRKRISF